MADEGGDGMKEIWETLFLLGGILVFLFILWFMNGGPEKEGIRGLFIKPLPPIDSGEVYGPTFREEEPVEQ
ncbi:hypothetical protein H7X87_00585 [Acetobacteraceae bacterium]|nr:hypothetical protein [Candidatus Parcubacteria bacterium]